MTSRSSITTERLRNYHAGEMLALEFMEPEGLTVEELAESLRVERARLIAVIDGDRPMDAELDLRLGKYFRLSEGYFLRLQQLYELREAKRALNGDLERILPRAA